MIFAPAINVRFACQYLKIEKIGDLRYARAAILYLKMAFFCDLRYFRSRAYLKTGKNTILRHFSPPRVS